MGLHCLVALWRTIRCELFVLNNRCTHPPSCRSHSDTVDNNLRLVEDLQCRSIHPDASWFLAQLSSIGPFSLGGEKLKQDMGEILVPTLNRIKEVHARVDRQNNAQFQ